MHEHFVHLTVTVCTNIAHSSEPETITPGFHMLPANSLLKWTDLAYDQKLARWKQKSNNTRNVSKQASCKQQHSSCWRSCSFRTRSGNCKSHLRRQISEGKPENIFLYEIWSTFTKICNSWCCVWHSVFCPLTRCTWCRNKRWGAKPFHTIHPFITLCTIQWLWSSYFKVN